MFCLPFYAPDLDDGFRRTGVVDIGQESSKGKKEERKQKQLQQNESWKILNKSISWISKMVKMLNPFTQRVICKVNRVKVVHHDDRSK